MNEQASATSVIEEFNDLKPRRYFIDNYPDRFTKSRLDWFMRNREANGLDQHVRKIAGQYYISEEGLLTLIMEGKL
jgi:hypothetical protein